MTLNKLYNFRKPFRHNILNIAHLTLALGLILPAYANAGIKGYEIMDLQDVSIAELRAMQNKGQLNAEQLTQWYIDRIHKVDHDTIRLNSILELNPDALAIAKKLDQERANNKLRGPLHGIPIAIKDSIDTADKMNTTAGSWALMSSKPKADANIVSRLRNAGAIILAKANMSEFGGVRTYKDGKYGVNPNGWSGRGGVTKNPYRLNADSWGSSSGSAVSVSANMVTAAIGTDAGGSVILPSSANGVVGLRTTIGLIGRGGLMPTSPTFGTAGIHTTNVRDAAIILNVLAGEDPRDPKSQISEQFVVTNYEHTFIPGFLKSKRIGILSDKNKMGGVNILADIPDSFKDFLKQQGAELIYVTVPRTLENAFLGAGEQKKMMTVEYVAGLNQYLKQRQQKQELLDVGWPIVDSVGDLIAFNEQYSRLEFTSHFSQDFLKEANKIYNSEDIEQALHTLKNIQAGARKYVDGVFEQYQLDAMIGPFPESFMPEAATSAGYPRISLPMGLDSKTGLPISMEIAGTAYSEATLLGIAYAIEQKYKGRVLPQYLP